MIRFIFVCMTLVALSILTLAGQYMMHGIEEARMTVAARNADTVKAVDQATAPTGPSFEEIYAMMPAPTPAAPSTNPEDLNAIEAAAGEDTFSAPFTGIAPKALADDVPEAAVAETPALENSSN